MSESRPVQAARLRHVGFMVLPCTGDRGDDLPRRGSEFERQMKAARDGIVQELVDRQIILTEFNAIQKDKGAGIKDQFVDEEIKRQIRELFNSDEAKFQLELKPKHVFLHHVVSIWKPCG